MKKDEAKSVSVSSATDDKKAGKRERCEKGEIRAMGKLYGMEKLASEAIEKGQSLEDFREALLSRVEKSSPSLNKNEEKKVLAAAFSLESASIQELHTAIRVLAIMYIALATTENSGNNTQYNRAMSLVSKILDAVLHAPHWPTFGFSQTPGDSDYIN